MTPSISIIIPAYEAERTIGKCLRSIATQKFTDFEIIVSNDGSTDHTLDEIDVFKVEFPNVNLKVISYPNGGVSLARKRGLEIAAGEWVTFVDADDTLTSDALNNLFKLTDTSTDLIVGFVIPAKKHLRNYTEPSQWQYAMLNGEIPPNLCGKLYRRELLAPKMFEMPREITVGEDTLVNLAYSFVMKRPPRFTYAKIYNYTINWVSLSHSTKRNLDYEYKYDQLRLKAIPESFRKQFMGPITKYRLNGLLNCCYSDPETIALKKHPFFNVINDGIKQSHYKLSLFEWIAIKTKTKSIIKYSGFLRTVGISLRYRCSRLINKN